jgi:arginine N-succinyltransferase
MAEMRGWQDEENRSPFWESVGARFFSMDFAAADKMSAVRGSDFIAELLPKHPIHINLLPDEAREVIGKPHRDSAPALAMLLREGFRFEGYVDVFDAGPQVHCNRDQVATVRRSREGEIHLAANNQALTENLLIASRKLNQFRVVAASASLDEAGLSVGQAALTRLGVEPGETVRFAAFHGD